MITVVGDRRGGSSWRSQRWRSWANARIVVTIAVAVAAAEEVVVQEDNLIERYFKELIKCYSRSAPNSGRHRKVGSKEWLPVVILLPLVLLL